MPDFDLWAKDKIISSNDKGEIWEAPYFKEMMDVILQGRDIDAFIQEKNENLHHQYIDETTAQYKKNIASKKEKINVLQDFFSQLKNAKAILDEFERDVIALKQHYPNPEHQRCINDLLSSYRNNEGKFEKDWSYNQLTQGPKGIFKKLINGRKHKTAEQCLEAFINKYEAINIPDRLSKLFESKVLSEIGDKSVSNLKFKFGEIIENRDNTDISQDHLENLKNIAEKVLSYKENIRENEKEIESNEKSFKESTKISREENIIHSFCSEIRGEIQNPQNLNQSNYVECLDKLPDNEIVMFNIGLKAGNEVSDKAKNVLSYNGLDCGSNTDQWLIREEKISNSDEGRCEIFSPLMTVKEAKEIMPKLMADLDRAYVSSGLAIPMKAKDIFKERTREIEQTEITKEGLLKLVGGAYLKHKINNHYIIDLQESMKKIGIRSEEELPEVFSSLEEIKAHYSKEKFLFSGSTASDDYLTFSSRVGRNGIIYATPDVSYAAKYDGVTNVGFGEGTTATGDKYVSPIIGQLLDKDVKVGFINIYEQNEKEDKFFPNFGMEDYRKRMGNDEKPETYGVFEANNEGREPYTQKQAQTSANGRITRDQAINGYIRHQTEGNIKDGKTYFPLSFDAETYVTPEKNPLKAKIMHIEWGENEFFVPIPDKPNEIVQAIINKRTAKMEDTFSHNRRQDILVRIQSQKEEFNQGMIKPVRENDFIYKRKAQLGKSTTLNTNRSTSR